jgi:hypothetical protein
LVAAGFASEGVSGDEIIGFLESSFGVFRMQQTGNPAGWDRHGLQRALDDLARYGLVERGETSRFHITALGRLAGESAVEVETVLRAVACLRALRADDVTDPALIAIAQMSAELDDVYFPINKVSKHKEPQHWFGQLQAQGISRTILSNLQINVTARGQDTARAKKATACLYYISGMAMEEIERTMSQFGGAFDGSAGPIRSVTSRTCDVLPMIGRVAQLLHPGLALEQRIARLVLRLDLGIQGAVVDLARYAERSLNRADYRRISDAKMTDRDRLAAADENALLPLIGNHRRKLAALRDAVERWRRARPVAPPSAGLPPYQP